MISEDWGLGSPAGGSGMAGLGVVGTHAQTTPAERERHINGSATEEPATPTERNVMTFQGKKVRVLEIDDEVWFVATDVAHILGYGRAPEMIRSLDEDEKGYALVHTPGGPQNLSVINEQGLFRAVIKRELGYIAEADRATVKAFQRWVTHEVLPSIRRTGAYVVPETPEQLLARALVTAQGVIERKDEHIAQLTPRAEAWDELASADGDYAVADAANILKRAGVDTGPQRLFNTLGQIGWTYRGERNRWRPYAQALDAGYLTERAMPPYIDRETGDLVPAAPQVRITARGLERLRIRLGSLELTHV